LKALGKSHTWALGLDGQVLDLGLDPCVFDSTTGGVTYLGLSYFLYKVSMSNPVLHEFLMLIPYYN